MLAETAAALRPADARTLVAEPSRRAAARPGRGRRGGGVRPAPPGTRRARRGPARGRRVRGCDRADADACPGAPGCRSASPVRLARRHAGLRRRHDARRRLRGGAAAASRGPRPLLGGDGTVRRAATPDSSAGRPAAAATGGSPTRGSTPSPATTRSTTSPWWCRCATGPGSSPGCWPRCRRRCRWSSSTTGRPTRTDLARSPPSSARRWCGTRSARGPAAARNTGLAPRTHRPRRLPRLRRACPSPAGSARCAGTSTTRRSAVVGAPGPRRRPRPATRWLCRYEAARSSLDLGAATRRRCSRSGRVAYVPERRAARPSVRRC